MARSSSIFFIFIFSFLVGNVRVCGICLNSPKPIRKLPPCPSVAPPSLSSYLAIDSSNLIPFSFFCLFPRLGNRLLKSDSFFFFLPFPPSRQRTDETVIAAETSLPTQLLATTGKMKDKKTRVETFYGVASKRNTKGVFVSCLLIMIMDNDSLSFFFLK
ncbi:GPI-anchored surface protein, putative [Bodo saltans]|uniref:GPI-anchored surface protein, putative n=1 Tax=Bodo saltans TaxID=75058 RepID=A0A0S4JLX7_BODSA|nr:GPI-anchored surface protein, putative [Bodo saltans]|eukprot:CUG90395.1 GPI-anchored surface protein, putative [Bodo saltans]